MNYFYFNFFIKYYKVIFLTPLDVVTSLLSGTMAVIFFTSLLLDVSCSLDDSSFLLTIGSLGTSNIDEILEVDDDDDEDGFDC